VHNGIKTVNSKNGVHNNIVRLLESSKFVLNVSGVIILAISSMLLLEENNTKVKKNI